MKKSETIGNLALSLSKLQGEIRDAFKDQQGYGYKYAKLDEFLSIARPLLCKYNLAVSQLPGKITDVLRLETLLMHESGEWISGTIGLPFEKLNKMNLAQSAGAALSYARRYAFASILGFAATDEDTDAGEPFVPKVQDKTLHILVDLLEAKNVSQDKIKAIWESKGVRGLNEISEDHALKVIERLKGIP